MSAATKALLVVLLVLGLLVLVGYTTVTNTYNRLVTLEEGVNNGWAQVQNVLQRRLDLIPNLVETVKGYASHEREVLIGVTEARAKVAQARTPQEAAQADQELTSALARLLVVVERYPDLKANENFIRLQDELAGTENRIAVERRRYNDVVREYNQRLRTFPTVLLAGLLGFEKRLYFEAPEEAQRAPKVDFSRPPATSQ